MNCGKTGIEMHKSSISWSRKYRGMSRVSARSRMVLALMQLAMSILSLILAANNGVQHDTSQRSALGIGEAWIGLTLPEPLLCMSNMLCTARMRVSVSVEAGAQFNQANRLR